MKGTVMAVTPEATREKATTEEVTRRTWMAWREMPRTETATAEPVEQVRKRKARYETRRNEQAAMALVGTALGTAGRPRLLPGEPSSRAHLAARRPRQTARPASMSTGARGRVVRGAVYCWTVPLSRMLATP